MIHLYYANRLDALLSPLAQRLRPAVRERDPFTPMQVVVPNANLRQWLQFHLADVNQIVVHLDFGWLDHTLVDVCAPEGTRLADPRLLQMMMVRCFHRYLREQDATLDTLRAYLQGPGHPDTRMFQLAGRLTELFRQYGLSRQDLLKAWSRDEDWFVADVRNMERWQRRLWRDLFGENGMLARCNANSERQSLIALHQLDVPTVRGPTDRGPTDRGPTDRGPTDRGPTDRGPTDRGPTALQSFAPLHLFGLSYISRFHQRTLGQLAQQRDIHLYILNPCKTFWEDMQTTKESMRHQLSFESMMEDELFEPEENPLLQAWGRPGREYMRRLNALANYDFHDHFEISPANTLLEHLQNDILNRHALPKKPPIDQPDGTVRILGCASPRREAEAVAREIWNLLASNDDLALQDIAVIVTDMQHYQAEVEAAFQRLHGLRFNLVDGRMGRATRILDAVRMLLKLPDSRYTREAVCDLFNHPNFQMRFAYADPSQWTALVDQAAVFFGRSRAEQERQGMTYSAYDLYNWQQAFTRLLIGCYLHKGAEAVFTWDGIPYAPLPNAESAGETVRQFYTVAQSLLADTAAMPQLQLSASGWSLFFNRLIETYLAPLDGELGDFSKIKDTCNKIRTLEGAYDDPETPLSFALAREALLSELDSLTPHIGQYLADGVTVSSFMPMRPVPFKVVFVMGLDETRFPARPRRDTMDLRWVPPAKVQPEPRGSIYRELGDVTDSERDRYMFLETLVSTGERLILSYVNRDDTTEDPINPSPVLEEMRHALGAYCENFVVDHEPLKAYDEATPHTHDPRAVRLAAIKRFRETCADLAPSLMATHALTWQPAVRRAVGLAVPGDTSQEYAQQEHARDTLRLDLADLRAFLRCPLQATAKRVLQQRGLDDDLLALNDEPFVLSNRMKRRLLHQVLESLLVASNAPSEGQIEAQLQQVVTRAQLDGRVPSGDILRAATVEMHASLLVWLTAIKEMGGPPYRGRLALGDTDTTPQDQGLPPLRLSVPTVQGETHVEIHGTTQFLFGSDAHPMSVQFSIGKYKKSPEQFGHHLLDGFIDGMALAAQNYWLNLDTVLIAGNKTTTNRRTLAADAESARTYLRNLVADMLSTQHFYLLPADIATQTWRTERDDFQKAFERKLIEARTGDASYGSLCLSGYGPFNRWREAPTHPDAHPLVQRRLGSFFRLLFGEEPTP